MFVFLVVVGFSWLDLVAEEDGFENDDGIWLDDDKIGCLTVVDDSKGLDDDNLVVDVVVVIVGIIILSSTLHSFVNVISSIAK